MAKILCAISGIEFKADYMPLYLTSRECAHPIFSVPATKLLDLFPRWYEQELEPTESYLLYLALFNATGLMYFRVPAMRTSDTDAIVAQHMHHLFSLTEQILNESEARKQEILHLPTFVITPDTKDLTDSGEWLNNWKQCFVDYRDRYRTATELEKLQRKETILERHIKDKTKDITTWSHQLASWAAIAGKFPQFSAGLDKSILGGKQMTLAEYWQYIIKACAKTETIWDIPNEDIQELLEHCEDTIEHGSIFAHTLMTLLREGLDRKKNFLNFGDIDLNSGNSFRILDASASVEDANIIAMIDSAPLSEPKESDYPNKLAFIKAKLKWKTAQEYKDKGDSNA